MAILNTKTKGCCKCFIFHFSWRNGAESKQYLLNCWSVCIYTYMYGRKLWYTNDMIYLIYIHIYFINNGWLIISLWVIKPDLGLRTIRSLNLNTWVIGERVSQAWRKLCACMTVWCSAVATPWAWRLHVSWWFHGHIRLICTGLHGCIWVFDTISQFVAFLRQHDGNIEWTSEFTGSVIFRQSQYQYIVYIWKYAYGPWMTTDATLKNMGHRSHKMMVGWCFELGLS